MRSFAVNKLQITFYVGFEVKYFLRQSELELYKL